MFDVGDMPTKAWEGIALEMLAKTPYPTHRHMKKT
jgi:hypothetical protein